MTAEEATIRRLYLDEGLTQDRVAAAMGLSISAVYRRMKSYGIAARPRAKPKCSTRTEVDEQAGVVRLHLRHGLVGFVDLADLPLLEGWAWWADKKGGGRWYVTGHLRADTTVRRALHQHILPTPDGYYPDHVNRDGLDNRRANLRPATCQQNAANHRKPVLSRQVSSRFRGVSFNPRSDYRRRWIATLRVNGSRRRSSWTTEEEAARAYDAMAREVHGEFAGLNFPGEATR